MGTSTSSGVADWVRSLDDPAAREKLTAFLTEQGFQKPSEALTLLRRSQSGNDYGEATPEARARAAEVAPLLLNAAAATSAPDDALRAIDSLADAMPSRATFDQFLQSNGPFLERLCSLAVGSPYLWQTVMQRPEYLDLLSDEAQLARPSDTPGPTPAEIAAYIRRERLRLGASDLWGRLPMRETLEQTTRVAQTAIAAALRAAGVGESGLAVIGLGKLGGSELNYGSDLDVLWVAANESEVEEAARIAEQTMRLLKEGLKPHGVSYDIDARLRPEGRFGRLARPLDSYLDYYAKSADTWELQALLKARPVAGDLNLGARYSARVRELIYGSPLTDAQLGEMRHMKQRIEKERAKGAADVKLGPGGLSDIEWIAQRLQWQWGKRWPRAQTPGTLAALTALRDAGVLRQDDWELLTETYLALSQARNRIWLRAGRNNDTPPVPTELTERRTRVRAVFARLFLG